METEAKSDIPTNHRPSTADIQLRRLTPREREVARLVADGLTNRQIGQQLVASRRTVDTHMQRILSKLDCSSRVEVAVLVSHSQPFARTGER